MDIQLTKSQQSAIAAFRKFLEDDVQVFMLKGAAERWGILPQK